MEPTLSESLRAAATEIGVDALRWLPGIVAAALSLLVFWLLWVAARRVMDALFQRAHLDPTAAGFLTTLVKLGIGLVAVLTALAQVGVDTTSILASMGVVGLTLGFAAQDTLANVISGLFVFWDRPFVIGDLVEVDGEYGRVSAITLRSTRLVTPDGRMFAIPNKVIANAKVASYTNFPHLRLDLDVTVGVGEDIGRCRRVLLEVVEGDPAFLDEPPPQVHVMALNDYNIALQLRVWLDDETSHIAHRTRVREGMLTALRAAGIEMPFETIRVEFPSDRATPTDRLTSS